MRSVSAPELTTLAATTRRITHRVKVKNGSGTYIDLSTWTESVEIDQDIEQPVSGCTVTFRRDSGTTLSLSPLRTDSTLNRLDNGTTYSPQLDVGRSITVEVATTPVGTAPVAADYKLLFQGTIDIVNFESSPVVVTCRDLGAPLVDRWIEQQLPYGGPAEALETVMQEILDAHLGAGAVPLYIPVSPSHVVPEYQQQRQSVMDAMQALAVLPGFDARYRWDDGTSTYRFTLHEPPRDKTVPDHTFGPSYYIEVTRVELDLTNIRNVVTVEYFIAGGGGGTASVTVSDAPSITKYGRRYFFIPEAPTSPIDTAPEATSMAEAALSDLKDPKAEFEIDAPFFWPADLWDLYRFTTNSVHFDTTHDWAVVSVKHVLARNRHRTIIAVRGQPAGAYSSWLTREGIGGGVGGAVRAPIALVELLDGDTDDLSWNARFDAIAGSGGGGTNIVWEVHIKSSFLAEFLSASGTGATLPFDTILLRGVKHDRLVRYVVADTATGLSNTAFINVPSRREILSDADGRIDPAVPTSAGYQIFQRLLDTAADVVSTAARTFIEPGMVDGSLRVVNVYRTATTEPVGNLFKRGTDQASDVVITSTRTFVDPQAATQVDASGRIVGVYRLGVYEPVNNLVKAGDAYTGAVPDSSLTSNIARLNTVQTFSAAQTFTTTLVGAAGVYAGPAALGTTGQVRLLTGGTNIGYVEWYTQAGVRQGYMGYLTSGVNLTIEVGTFGIHGNVTLDATNRLYLDGGSDTYIYEQSANLLDFVAGGVQALRLASTYVYLQYVDLILAPTKKIYLDGGGDTYIYESSANNITFVTGGVTSAHFFSLGLAIPATLRVYLDGGGDTYIYESAANVLDLVAGGSTRIRANTVGANVFGTLDVSGVATLAGVVATAQMTEAADGASAQRVAKVIIATTGPSGTAPHGTIWAQVTA